MVRAKGKRFMLKTVAMVNLKFRWLIDQISIIGKIALTGLLLASCVVPVPYGAYYYPTYPEKSQYVWIMRNNEGTGAPEELRMRSDGCVMGLRAIADEENFTFSWSQQELGNAVKCRIHVHTQPLVLEDLDSGSQRDIRAFRRVFRGFGPALGLEEAVNLKSLIPGFAAVPASARRYTLSISLERKFEGPLPEVSRIQLPEISIAGRAIKPPPLQLNRHANLLSSKDDYLPDNGKRVQDTVLLAEFGGSVGPIVIWYEELPMLRLGAAFWGTPDSYDGNVRNKNVSEILGRIYVEIFGDGPIHLEEGGVTWYAPGDTTQQFVPVSRSKWAIEMYTTADISEQLENFADYWQQNKTFKDWYREFVILLRGYQPKHFRVMLPPVDINGHEWFTQPINFEYKSGGVGLGGL
jgi:hypothetical protein